MMRRVLVLLASAALLGVASARPASAQVVRASIGGELSGRRFQQIEVPVVVDLTGAPGRNLGGYRLRVSFDPTVLDYNTITAGNFAPPQTFQDSAGSIRVAALFPAGATGRLTLFALTMFVVTDSVVSPITLTLEELTEAGTFADLLPITQVTNGSFCRSLGRWGDTNGDNRSDSRDALIALSRVVGLIDSVRIDTLNLSPLVTDTIRSTLADVDSDGSVTSRDALVILSHAVGLPVNGFRIGLTAAGACATGSGTMLAILPDTIDLQSRQIADVVLQARDAAGRVVPVDNVTWTTSDANVAAFIPQNPFDDLREGVAGSAMSMMILSQIEARSPGTAILVARMGPGIADTMIVNVVGRRRHWYASVTTALLAPTQTGTTRHPYGRIQDALSAAADGDTVHVAPGTYFEQIFEYRAVALLGDPVNRPVIDPRGVTSNPSYALEFGSPSGKATLAHFIVRHGTVYMEGHDNEVRRVRIENVPSFDVPLEIYSESNVQLSGAGAEPYSFGNVLVDSVDIVNSNYSGVMVDQGDTVIVRNVTVTNDSLYTSCSSAGAIAIYDAAHSEVRDNRLTNVCSGIEIDHDNEVGRSMVSRNRITGLRYEGIEVYAPVVRLDHNVVRDWSSQSRYSSQGRGIWVRDQGPGVDSLSLLGDSVYNVTHRGVVIDDGRIAVIDSLYVTRTGQDSSFGSDGLMFGGTRLTLTNSRFRDIVNGDGIISCDNTTLRSRGNLVRDVTFNGITSQDCSDEDAPDSLITVRDTIINAGGFGVMMSQGTYGLLDSLTVDSTANVAMRFFNVNDLTVRNSTIRRSQFGVAADNATSFTMRNMLIDGMVDGGVQLIGVMDTVRLDAITVNNVNDGFNLQSLHAVADSLRVTNAVDAGFYYDNSATVAVTRSRFTGNVIGVVAGSGAGAGRFNRSIIAGNVNFQGVRNDGIATLNADSVFWGDALGPACVSGCAPGSAGDSVLSGNVTFADHLSTADPIIPVPPAGVGATQPRRASPVIAPAAAATREPAPAAVRQPSAVPPKPPRRTQPRSQERRSP